MEGLEQMTPLCNAFLTGNLVIMAKRLAQSGADVKSLRVDGRNPLFVAIAMCNRGMLQFLLEQDFDPNAVDPHSDCTPLYALFVYGDPQTGEPFDECVELLLQHGAVPRKPKRALDTLLDLALMGQHFNAVDYLIAHVAMLDDSVARAAITFNHACLREKYSDSVEKCYESYQKILTINMYEKFTLIDLLKTSEREMRQLVRKETFVSEVEKVCSEYKFRQLYVYYYKTLMKRIANGAEILELEDKAIVVISKLFNSSYGLCYDFGLQLVGYLDKSELEILCQVYD